MTVDAKAKDAVAYLRSPLGLTKHAAVAVVSCLWYESKLNPGSQGHQPTETPGILNPVGAYGIASWNGPRQSALSSFADRKLLHVERLETQLHFVVTECANWYPDVFKAINSKTLTYNEIIPVFVAEYENPKNHEAEIAGSKAFAAQLYDSVPDAVPPPPPIPTAPPQPIGEITVPPEIIFAIVTYGVPIVEAIFRALLATHGVTPPAPGSPPGFNPGVNPGVDIAKLAEEVVNAIKKQNTKT